MDHRFAASKKRPTGRKPVGPQPPSVGKLGKSVDVTGQPKPRLVIDSPHAVIGFARSQAQTAPPRTALRFPLKEKTDAD